MYQVKGSSLRKKVSEHNSQFPNTAFQFQNATPSFRIQCFQFRNTSFGIPVAISEYHSPVSEYHLPVSEYHSPVSRIPPPVSEYHSPVSQYHRDRRHPTCTKCLGPGDATNGTEPGFNLASLPAPFACGLRRKLASAQWPSNLPSMPTAMDPRHKRAVPAPLPAPRHPHPRPSQARLPRAAIMAHTSRPSQFAPLVLPSPHPC